MQLLLLQGTAADLIVKLILITLQRLIAVAFHLEIVVAEVK